TVILGRWQTIVITSDSGETQPLPLTAQAPLTQKMRVLTIDGGFKEYTVGASHQVTDHLFVIRKVEHLNDALPDDHDRKPHWIWRLGGWISVNRLTGRVAQLNLSGFDPEISQASWYRDYAAYCGTSDNADGLKHYMIVVQLGRRRPLLRREHAGTGCGLPQWARAPSRVTFVVAGEKSSFVVRAHGADPQPEPNEEEGP
ncbi:MAG TPA: hypothetical protein VFL42_01565, partial [Terriglobales bacterium]|nr:hypothetical protein [Terriglobales bacterium]